MTIRKEGQPNGDHSLSPQFKGDILPPMRKDPLSSREELIEWWRNAPERVRRYEGGSYVDNAGVVHDYKSGLRLLIGYGDEAKQVMDTCETPWAFETVDKVFAEFSQKSGPLKVLERGFGMGITGRRTIQQLVTRGGEYDVIELNKANAQYAREWAKRQKSAFANMASGLPGTRPDIEISIIEGEAYEKTAELEKKGEQFDIIISDTYPLSENEEGINDLQDLETMKRCLKPGGVFAFFAYFPGSAGGIVKKQENMITPHFRNYSVSSVEVNPPPTYKYLQTEDGPVTRLAVVICKNPVL